MKPTLRQFQYLSAIAEAGSFSGAARLCNVSQPSLSAQIADMEAVLGVKLVERGRGGAPLTPAGRETVPLARRLLRDAEALALAARETQGSLKGRLVLGTLPSVGPYLLPGALRVLHKRYPELRLAIRELRTTDLEAGLSDGTLDMIISTPEDHPDMRSATLVEEELFAGIAPDDPLAAEDGALPLAALYGRDVLTLGEGHKFARLVRNLADLAGAGVSADYEGTSLDAIREMASMGGSVAVMPTLYVRSEASEDPGIVVRRIDHPEARRTISLIWRPTSPLGKTFATLAEVLHDSASGSVVPQ